MLKNKELGKITIQDLIIAQKNLINELDNEHSNMLSDAQNILVGMNSIYNRMTDKTLSG